MQVTRRPIRLVPEDGHAVPEDLDLTAAVLTFVGGTAAVLSAFLPWLETAGLGIALLKVDAPGLVLAALAVISMALAGFVLVRRSATPAVAVVLILLGAAQLGLASWHLADVVNAVRQVDSRLVLMSIIGTGLYMGVMGSMVTLAGGILAWTRRSSQ